ncbi:MAG: hypothetical protein Q9M40_10935 [Sulfurimonas sp.]|nr:hypothetical protein [Sulfurimonas sp.]
MNLKKSPLFEEYEEIRKSYEEFHADYSETLKTEESKGIISDEDLKILKKMFRLRQ